jgi:hypothetical protein
VSNVVSYASGIARTFSPDLETPRLCDHAAVTRPCGSPTGTG